MSGTASTTTNGRTMMPMIDILGLRSVALACFKPISADAGIHAVKFSTTYETPTTNHTVH